MAKRANKKSTSKVVETPATLMEVLTYLVDEDLRLRMEGLNHVFASSARRSDWKPGWRMVCRDMKFSLIGPGHLADEIKDYVINGWDTKVSWLLSKTKNSLT